MCNKEKKMKKNLMRILSIITCLIFLTGCTIPGIGNNDPFSNPGAGIDPVKPAEPANPDEGDGKDGDVQIDVSIIPTTIEVSYEVRSDVAGVDITVDAKDENAKTLWKKSFEKVMVGQYDTHTVIGPKNTNYYIVVSGTLYCLNICTGDELWTVDTVGASCAWDFDDKDNLYIAGYDGPALVVIDKNGKELHRYDQIKNKVEYQDFYWVSGLYYEDGKVRCTYDSSPLCLIIDPETGEGSGEEFGEIKIERIDRKWKMLNYYSNTDKDTHFAAELDGECTISITDDYYFTFSYSNGNDKYDCSYVSCCLRPFDLFEGISDYYYGVWTLECKADECNSFAYQMSDPDTLNLLWFRKDADGNDLGYMSFEFMDEELLQYYQDKLKLDNQNK